MGDVVEVWPAWPEDPNGSLVPLLEASVEAAKQRHPSALPGPSGDILTGADRCDHCGGSALYRVQRELNGVARVLDFCRHFFVKSFPAMAIDGWRVVGANPELFRELESDG